MVHPWRQRGEEGLLKVVVGGQEAGDWTSWLREGAGRPGERSKAETHRWEDSRVLALLYSILFPHRDAISCAGTTHGHETWQSRRVGSWVLGKAIARDRSHSSVSPLGRSQAPRRSLRRQAQGAGGCQKAQALLGERGRASWRNTGAKLRGPPSGPPAGLSSGSS